MDDATSLRITLVIQQIVFEMVALGTFARGWRRGRSRWDRATYGALALGYAVFGAAVGRWDVVSTWLRPALVVSVALGSLVLVALPVPAAAAGSRGRAFWARLALVTAIGLVVTTQLVQGALPDALALAFPLRDGRYYVVQGGASRLLNYHRVNPTQKFALDITKLGASNRRADGVLPTDPDRYFIFGDAVRSPCAGRVRHAVDGVPASGIPSGRVQEPAGNHLAIDCDGTDATVVLAHLQSGSLRARAGDKVALGQPVALVGQSGHSSEPHLHVHAARHADERGRGGVGIPLTFDGRFLIKNDEFAPVPVPPDQR